MKARPPASLLALVALLAAPGPRLARAAERGCPAIAVEPDAGFRARFPDLLGRIQDELAARADLDACAHVTLRFENAEIDVAVTLPDGRSASRSVARREDVMPTLQALLLVPDPPPRLSAPPLTPPPTRPKRAARHRRSVEPAALGAYDMSSGTPPAARELGFELSAISGVRLGDGQYGYGVGVLSFLEVHRWLVGFEGRADGYRSIHGGDPQTALELAILAGRRFDFGTVALDFTAGPGVAMKGVTFSDVQRVEVMGTPPAMPPPPPPRDEPSSGPVPRLLVGARLGFSPRSIFRTFVGIDGELGPSRSATDPQVNVSSPRMPTFTVGLALGATVGTP